MTEADVLDAIVKIMCGVLAANVAIFVALMGVWVNMRMRREPYKEYFYKRKFDAYGEIMGALAKFMNEVLSIGENREEAVQNARNTYAASVNGNVLWSSLDVRERLRKIEGFIRAIDRAGGNVAVRIQREEIIADHVAALVKQMDKELHTYRIPIETDSLFEESVFDKMYRRLNTPILLRRKK